MKVELFDRYDIRTRICAFVFVITPFLLDAYILVEAVRSLTSTFILTVTLISASGMFTCWVRYLGNTVTQVDYITEFLLPESNELNDVTRNRYIEKLCNLEPGLVGLSSPDPLVRREAAQSASVWLREKMRGEGFGLVQEEGLNYGFFRNVYAVKSVFLLTYTFYTALLVAIVWFTNQGNSFMEYLGAIPSTHVLCGLIHVGTYMIWGFGITKVLFQFVSQKYARAVVRAIDRI